MGARGETLAKQFEAKADEAVKILCGHVDEHLGSIRATVGS
jgi:hypothetical protein